MPASVSFLTVEFRSRWIRFHYAGDKRTFFSVGKKYKNTHPHNATFSCLAQSHLFAHYSAVCFVSAAESRGLKALIEFRRKESRQTMSRPARKEHRFQLVRNPTHRTRPHTCTMKLLVSSRHRARFEPPSSRPPRCRQGPLDKPRWEYNKGVRTSKMQCGSAYTSGPSRIIRLLYTSVGNPCVS